jgi:precorrin-2 dehydrogenase / sirohydrochlorin ferrochelatase
MGFYPLFLELHGRRCLVVGGGPVAERKVEGLLAAGAAVTVVSPTLTPPLYALLAAGRLQHAARTYQPGDLAGFDLGFAATDDGAVNGMLLHEGRSFGVWVNSADDLANSDFILPAIVRRGPLTVAVGSGGASPALVRAVREELERYLGPEYAELAELVGDVRRELRARGRSPDGATWHQALDADLRSLVKAGRREQARERLLDRLGAA